MREPFAIFYRLLPDKSTEPVYERSAETWEEIEHLLRSEGRQVGRSFWAVGGKEHVVLSTVFLVLGHPMWHTSGVDELALFETMTFLEGSDGRSVRYSDAQWRYPTWRKAEAGHERIRRRMDFALGGHQGLAALDVAEGCFGYQPLTGAKVLGGDLERLIGLAQQEKKTKS